MIDIATLGLAVDSSQVKQGAKSLDDLSASGARAEKSTASLTAASSRLAGAFGLIAGALATLGISRFITETAQLSQRYSELGIVLGVVAKNAGLSAVEVNKTAEAVRQSGISMIESRQIVSRLVTANIDLSKATELARLAQDAAVIGQINSSEALNRMVHGITSAQVEVLRGIGINVNFEKSYADLAKQIGTTASALTEQQKMQARLNVVLAESTNLNGVYAASMDNAGKQMRSTERIVEDLKVRIGQLFDETSRFAVTAYTNALKETDSAITSMTETGRLKAWGDAIARVAAFAADSVRSVGIVFDITGKAIGAMAAQVVAISKLDFKSAFNIQGNFNKDLDAAIGSMSKMRDIVEKQIVSRDLLVPAIERNNKSTKTNTVESLNNAAAKSKASTAIDKAAASVKKLTVAELQQQESTKRTIDLDRDVKQVIDSVATSQEIFNRELDELNRLKPHLSAETYDRALRKLNETTKQTAVVTRQTTDEMSQLWMQAGRNIQSTLANSIFNFFDDGLKGMLKNVISTVGRIASEFAALRIAQSIGLARMFGMPGMAAASGAASGGGALATGSNMLNIASLGSNALTFAKGGFGVTGLVGGGLKALGGMTGSSSLAAFGGGFGGDAIGGLAAGGFSSSAASAANLGSTMASFAGPAIAIAAVDQIVRLLAGNKAIEGVAGKILNYVPVIGPLINGLFGRGPLKQKETSLTGDIGGTGLLESGELSTHFKAKGGLFRSNKNDFAKVDLLSGVGSTDNNKALSAFTDSLIPYARQIAAQINETVGTVNTSLRGVADSLNLSVDPLDSFKRSINLISESGKALTDEQISNEINAITEEMARSLLPAVDQFAKFGETAVQTVSRLGAEFEALEQGAMNLGASAEYAKSLIGSLSIETRSRYLEFAGGADKFLTETAKFSQNFLTEAERMAPSIKFVEEGLVSLGFAADITREQFGDLIQTLLQSSSEAQKEIGLLLLYNQDVFLSVDNYKQSLNSLNSTTEILVESERSLNDIRQELLGSYNKERSEFENTISKFKTISDKLRDFRESLLFSELSPLTPAQRLEEARNQFNQTRLKAASGDETALNALPNVAQEFLKASQTYNASSSAYLSDFALVQNVLKNAEKSASNQVDVATKHLNELVKSVDYLLNIDNATKTTNDLIKELIAATLRGSGNQQYSTADIQGYLKANPNLTPTQVGEAATKYGVSGDQLRAAGYDTSQLNQALKGASISDRQIIDFVNANRSNPMAIYKAAVANGVTSQRLSSVSGIAMTDIQKFVKDNRLPSFAKGTDFVHKSGLAMVHRAEAIVPSSTTDEIKKLRQEIAEFRKDQNEHTGALVNVIDITTKQNSQEISGAVNNAQTQKSWSERNKVAFK